MHFELLVEGQTELTALSIIANQILGDFGQPHTWKIHKHRGIGRLPDDFSARPNRYDQTLLHNLPAKLRAYSQETRSDLAVVVLVDLDDRTDCVAFKTQLQNLLQDCRPSLKVLFRIAIEELEAWFLGDQQAILQAYPDAKQRVLDGYQQDSQVGTWETLADAIHPGGRTALRQHGKRSTTILEQKVTWAKKISPYLDVERNQSPSFVTFRDGLRKMKDA